MNTNRLTLIFAAVVYLIGFQVHAGEAWAGAIQMPLIPAAPTSYEQCTALRSEFNRHVDLSRRQHHDCQMSEWSRITKLPISKRAALPKAPINTIGSGMCGDASGSAVFKACISTARTCNIINKRMNEAVSECGQKVSEYKRRIASERQQERQQQAEQQRFAISSQPQNPSNRADLIPASPRTHAQQGQIRQAETRQQRLDLTRSAMRQAQQHYMQSLVGMTRDHTSMGAMLRSNDRIRKAATMTGSAYDIGLMVNEHGLSRGLTQVAMEWFSDGSATTWMNRQGQGTVANPLVRLIMGTSFSVLDAHQRDILSMFENTMENIDQLLASSGVTIQKTPASLFKTPTYELPQPQNLRASLDELIARQMTAQEERASANQAAMSRAAEIRRNEERRLVERRRQAAELERSRLADEATRRMQEEARRRVAEQDAANQRALETMQREREWALRQQRLEEEERRLNSPSSWELINRGVQSWQNQQRRNIERGMQSYPDQTCDYVQRAPRRAGERGRAIQECIR
jgi:hypothetical protein